MEIQTLAYDLTVCKVTDLSQVDLSVPLCFAAVTDNELSLVCPTDRVPANTIEREDGWKAFRIKGTLDFSLIGILAELSGLLAKNGIGIFAVSTYDTDYILTKKEQYQKAITVLIDSGKYTLV